jgi:hypothetical protein
MLSKLRSVTKPTESSRRSSRLTRTRLTATSSSLGVPTATNQTTDVSPPSSPSERGSLYLPSSSDSETMVESYCCLGKSRTKSHTPLTYSSLPITHCKTSLSPSLSGSTPYSTAPPLPTIPSVVPLPTSTTGTPLPKLNATADKTTDCVISAMSSPSSKLRCISLRMISRRAAIASKPPASHPTFRIWREEPGQRTTPHANAPLEEGVVEDQEVQTRMGGDDTVLYPRLHVIHTNWA